MIPYQVEIWLAEALFALGPKLFTAVVFFAGVAVGYALRTPAIVVAKQGPGAAGPRQTRS